VSPGAVPADVSRASFKITPWSPPLGGPELAEAGFHKVLKLALMIALAASLAGGCTSEDTAKTSVPTNEGAAVGSLARESLVPVALPDLSRVEKSVQEQVREQYSSLLDLQKGSAPAAELGNAYGAMGKLLMAAEQFDAAESYLLNSQTLLPGDYRWPYYLGHLNKSRGALAKSVASFERALQLQPHDVTTLFWLGEVHLIEGRPEVAEQLFAQALSRDSRSAPARFGLGRAALAKQDYKGAVKHLEDASALNDQAVNIHYPLALAYRALGETEKAEAHLRQRGDFELLPPDPLMQELKELLESAIGYELRGERALGSGDWTAAAGYFRKGLELAPASPSLRHKLGTALFMMGDARAALQQFEQVVQVSPEYAKAHYSLGVLMQTSGRTLEAVERFSAAVKHAPDYVEARVRLAELLRRSGRLQDSLSHYRHVLAIDPRAAEASFGYAMALVRLRRYQEARDRLSDATKLHPDQAGLAHALARLLSAAPDDRVRDGRRAMAVMQGLADEQRRMDSGETMAMMFAELGQYEEAAAWQREAMAAASRAGRADLAQRMAGNLRLYEARRPCRTPWRDEDFP
jgi:tetratricopeptide (TPR) repeat protein